MNRTLGGILWVVLLVLAAPFAAADNTAGCMLHVDQTKFNHANLQQLTWTETISEYDTVPAGTDPFRLRIEFDSVGFMGSRGICYVGAMVQNLGHAFTDDAVGSIDSFPALGLYMSSLQSAWPDSWHGVMLNVDPNAPPQFGRVFENVDGLGFSAKNIYTRQNVGTPSPANPITVTWTVTKGETVSSPPGNFSRSLDGNWIPLSGQFVRWNFKIAINGTTYNVADYYLPIGYAKFLLSGDPLVLHQEYFGAAEQILGSQKGSVRYSNMRAFDGKEWWFLADWKLTGRIDDGAGNFDNRFGWMSDGSSLTSRVGHETDVTDCARDVGAAFTVVPTDNIPTKTVVSSATAGIGTRTSLKAKLTRSDTHGPVVDGGVQFFLDGVPIGSPVASNSLGLASLAFTAPESLALGKHTLTAQLAAAGGLLASSGTGTLTAVKGKSTLKAVTVTGTPGSQVTLSATLTNGSAQPLTGRTVTFSVGGSGVGSGITNGSGKATCLYTIPVGTPLGKTTYSVAFAGDAYYLAKLASGTITVK